MKINYRLSFRPIVIIIYLLLLALLISMGNWQLNRAKQKRLLLRQRQASLQLPPIDINKMQNLTLDKLEYRKVVVEGRWDPEHQFLIDNQMHQGKVGYYVMTPLFIAGKKNAVLVNRGWLPMNKNRKILPDIALLALDVRISGRVNHFPQVAYQLKGADIPTSGWPAVVQVINPVILSERLDYPILDFQIELDPLESNGFVREWKIIQKMPAEKHYAYAMQWFGLAVTLTILMLWMSLKKTDE